MTSTTYTYHLSSFAAVFHLSYFLSVGAALSSYSLVVTPKNKGWCFQGRRNHHRRLTPAGTHPFFHFEESRILTTHLIWALSWLIPAPMWHFYTHKWLYLTPAAHGTSRKQLDFHVPWSYNVEDPRFSMKSGPLRPHEQMLLATSSQEFGICLALKVNINRMYHFKAIVNHQLYWKVIYD